VCELATAGATSSLHAEASEITRDATRFGLARLGVAWRSSARRPRHRGYLAISGALADAGQSAVVASRCGDDLLVGLGRGLSDDAAAGRGLLRHAVAARPR
jgi:hypothetical protein